MWDFFQPILGRLEMDIIAAAVAWASYQFTKRTGIAITEQQKQAVQNAAQNAAGRILAAAQGDTSALSFDVLHPAVKAETVNVLNKVGDSAKALGLDPGRIADIIVGKLGILQSQAAGVPAKL